MKKLLVICCFLLTAIVFQVKALDRDIIAFSGDLTTIYTLGNAADTQKIPEPGAGSYAEDLTKPARKNGFFTAANIYVDFHPLPWLDGYFKIYAQSRPGSVYLPLQMENLDAKDFSLTLDAVYGRASILQALNLDVPLDLYVKAGKYKAQASSFGAVSRYGTEQILYMMNTKTDFTYELGVDLELPFKLNAAIAANYRLNEATQRYYDKDGMQDHGIPVPNKFAPQILGMAKLEGWDLPGGMLSAELLYGNNVSNIYSGHSAGLSARYNLGISDDISLPIGLIFSYYQKNIDLLANAAVVPEKGDNTMDYRDSLGAGLGAGFRYSSDFFRADFNLAGTFFLIKHYYRDNLPLFKLSADALFTFQKHYFLGAGFIAGTLGDVTWKTSNGADLSKGGGYYEHTFTFGENVGYEIYAGLNLSSAGKIIIGFNQNKGLSLNNMLEAKTDGQMKYKQLDTEWKDRLVEAGGLYFKFTAKF